MSPAPKFELPIAQEGMVYKIWDSVYKIVQNNDILFVLEIRFGGPVTCTSTNRLFRPPRGHLSTFLPPPPKTKINSYYYLKVLQILRTHIARERLDCASCLSCLSYQLENDDTTYELVEHTLSHPGTNFLEVRRFVWVKLLGNLKV